MSPARTVGQRRAEDRTAREVAQTVFDRPIVLQAGAGTGKTAALVCRVVAYCLDVGWARAEAQLRASALPNDPEPDAIAARVLSRVVAITFTEAAAAEMASRIDAALAHLEARGSSPPLPAGLLRPSLPESAAAIRGRARALRGQLDRLSVRTIHAFCRRLLAMNCVDAGLHPRFEVDASGALQAEIVREVVEARLRDAFGDPGDPEFVALLADEIGPLEIEEALAVLVSRGVRPEALDENPYPAERVSAQVESLRGLLREFLDAYGEALDAVPRSSSRTHGTLAALRAARDLAAAHTPVSASELDVFCQALRETVTPDARDRLRTWGREDFGVREASALGALADSLAPRAAALAEFLSRAASWQPLWLERARGRIRPLLDDVHARMRARGVETFQGLLIDARDLLEARPDVCSRERRRIDQLLVDEFQDTDALQCDVLRRLALEGPAEDRPGLFLVGDPKQSIYGWRNADLAAYEQFVEQAVAAGGKQYALTENFRSVPAILDEVERVVAPVMAYRRGLQPDFEGLIPSRERSGQSGFAVGERAAIEHWLPCAWDAAAGAPQKTSAARATEIEARALARDLRALHDEHAVDWGQIGVLFRAATDLETYLVALRDAGVPYAVEHDRNYYQRREVIDAAALLRCIMDPNDQLALLTWLRSPCVGVPDAALIPLWTRGFPALVTELESSADETLGALRRTVAEAARALPGDVPGLERLAGWERGLVAALEALAALRESFETEPADVFLERVRRVTLLEATEAARYLGAYRVANLEQLFRDLCAELGERGEPQSLLRGLRRSIGESPEAEGGRPLDSAERAVRIMTIHGAKGLGFEHVYVMQLHKAARSRGDANATDAGEVGGRLEYRLLGAPTLDFADLERNRREVEEAERVRTLYVAMTRARERLVLSGLRPELALHGSAPSHMQLVTQRRDWPQLGALTAAVEPPDAAGVTDPAAVRWVIPERAPAPRPAPARSTARESFCEPDAVAAAATALAEHRAAAVVRASRAFRGAASEEHKDDLEETVRAWYGDVAPASEASATEPEPRAADLARHVGTAVHRALEIMDPAADPARELPRLRAELERALAARLPPARRVRAQRDAEALMDRIARGRLFAQLRALGPRIVARELPVLLPPAGDAGPVGFVSGAIDLVYRDPDTDALVVADYKTDAVETEREVVERAKHYAAQGRTYVRALRDALALPYEPRFELWFLHADRITRAA
ncbi:MAG: UvrD-helicase domain-containing protein [Deltaproteobacteria bacterium]|nr:MAG: UvrD-helicase domain-containing protein [Deltaproteobacteria bacterium]